MENLKPLDVQRLGPGRHSDGRGLYLEVTSGGGRCWVYRYQLHGKEHFMGLGSARDVPLKVARKLAADARQLRATGIDPLGEKRARRSAHLVDQARSVTFRECAGAYIVAHEAGWKNPKHRYQWRATLEQYAYPIIGGLPVQAIDTALVLKVLQPIWLTKTETASRVRGRIESILDYAKVREYRTGENPARWRGHLDHLLPLPSKVAKPEHLAALPYGDLGAFMADLRRRDSTSARALEFTILTAARTGEVIGMQWSEVDLVEKAWLVPADRMKAGREHRVPLSDRACEILRDIQRRCQGDYVFPGQRNAGMSNMALTAVMRVMGVAGVTVHGFRSTFRTWAAERSNFPREVVEVALAHVVGDKVEQAYQRGDLFEKRRRLMDAWSDFCGKSGAIGKVIAMNATVTA